MIMTNITKLRQMITITNQVIAIASNMHSDEEMKKVPQMK